MTAHTISMLKENDNDYGVMFKSAYVYMSAVCHGPTRVVLWSNLDRPNPDLGKPLGAMLEAGDRRGCRVTKYSLKYTAGRYLDPHNEPTDDPFTVLLTPESSVITSNGTNTGTVASGQVYARPECRLADLDRALLVFPAGPPVAAVLHFPRYQNGHGHAEFISRGLL